jgi:hypothetical protein
MLRALQSAQHLLEKAEPGLHQPLQTHLIRLNTFF